MSLLHVIHQQGRWLVFDGQSVSRSESRPRLQRAAVVVSDFEGAVSNVIALEGSPTHAVALIEKRLRSDGLIDSESKILVHRSRSMGAGYQTLFTAVPLDLWQQTYAWAEAQPDHCLLVPFTSLLWKSLKPGQGVVLQSGRQLSVLALLKHQIVYRTSLAYSDDPDDLAMAVGSLAEQFASDLDSGEDSLQTVSLRWCPVLVPRPADGAEWGDEVLRGIFAARSGIEVASVPLRRVLDGDGAEYRSGIAWIEANAGASVAVNPLPSRLAWLAEWGLPIASAASLVFALALGTLGARWTLSASEANERAARLGDEISGIEGRIEALRSEEGIPQEFGPTLQFVERAAGLQGGADPTTSLARVRDAAGGEVRILRVRLEDTAGAGPRAANAQARRQGAAPSAASTADRTYTLRVDGVVDAHRGTPGMQVPNFVEGLRRMGFEPVPIDPQGSGSGSGSGSGNRSAGGFFSYLLRTPEPPRAGGQP